MNKVHGALLIKEYSRRNKNQPNSKKYNNQQLLDLLHNNHQLLQLLDLLHNNHQLLQLLDLLHNNHQLK